MSGRPVAGPRDGDGDALHRIVYISRATRPLDRAELVALCDDSHRRNVQRGVTGLLLHDGDRFIQALEGPGLRFTRSWVASNATRATIRSAT